MSNDHDDMIDAVRASVAELSEPAEKAAPETAAAAPEPEQETSASERARDEKGRFVASEEKAEQPVKQATAEAVKAPVVESTPQLQPPTSWSPEARTEFSKLSPAVQQAVLKREEEMNRGSQQYSDERQRLRMLEGVIAPRREYFGKHGFKSDAEAINHLLTLSDFLERDPYAAVAHIARSANVDLNKLTAGVTEPAQQQQIPSQQFQQPINVQQQVEEAISQRFALMTVQEFEANPPEHYQEVKPLMQMLLEKGQAKDLQEAYDTAVWMNPNIRSRLLEAQRAKEQQELAAKSATKVVQKVKAANASLSGGPHGVASAPARTTARGQFGDVAEDVRSAIASLM